MIFHKLFAFSLVAGLVLNTTVAAQTATTDVKRAELSPELKQNALKIG